MAVFGTLGLRPEEQPRSPGDKASPGSQRPTDPGRFVQTRENRVLRESWIPLSLLVVLIGITAGEIVIALIGSGVFVAGWLARLWGRLALTRLDVAQELSQDHAFVGESIRYRMRISNRKLLPLPWLSLRTEVPEVLAPLGRNLEPIGTPKMARLDRLTGLRWYERLTWDYTIPLNHRGYFAFGRTALRAGDLFGFFTRERVVPTALTLWVYPPVLPMDPLGLPARRPLGEERGADPLFDDPARLRGLRDYQAGDPLRRVDWRATARRQALQTRTYDPASSPSLLLALNVATMPEAWQGFYGELFERAVTVCASLATAYADARVPFGLVANCTYPGRDGTIRLPMGRAQSQMIRALESLAMVDVYAVAPIERVLQDECRRVPQGSTVALVTAIVTPALVVTLADLRRRGLSVSVIWAGTDDPPRLPTGVALHDMRSALAGRRFYRPFTPGMALDAPELFDWPLNDRPLGDQPFSDRPLGAGIPQRWGAGDGGAPGVALARRPRRRTRRGPARGPPSGGAARGARRGPLQPLAAPGGATLMSVALRWLAGDDVDARGAVAASSVVLLEGLLLIVVAGLAPRMVGAHGEIPSAAAVLVLLGGGALYAHRLDEADLPRARRWLLGVAVSVVALQVVGRVDLSETTRIWSFGWAADISDPSSGAWRGSQHLDHVLGMAVLTFAWFRGVALGNSDLADRSLAQLVPLAAIVFVVGFLAGDAAQIVDRVRIAALAFLAVALLAVAFRNAQRLTAGGGFGAVGLTFLSTLGAMLVVAIVFMLIVTLLVAAVGGSGIAEPVTDALGWLLRIVATGVAWVVWTLLWPLRQLVGSGAPPLPPQEICFLNEAGELECVSELERDLDLEPNTGDDPLGAVVFRVFAGIGLVLGLTILAALLFRQVWRRRRTPDEERESLWDEADPLGDLWSGLRALAQRLRPHGRAEQEPGIAGLYLEMLADAQRRGAARPAARTPRQFAPTLERLYRSALPSEISERFNEQRYAGREPTAADVARLRLAFETVRDAHPG